MPEMFEWLGSLSEGESVAIGLLAILGAIWATIHGLTLDRIRELEQRTKSLEDVLDEKSGRALAENEGGGRPW